MKMLHARTYDIVTESMTDSQIGAKKKNSVRNPLFILNSIISDGTSSVKKAPIDLNVMDFRQMFDAEDLSVCLNSFYDAGVQNDILALLYEANRENVISVKTQNVITKKQAYKKISCRGTC